MLKEKSPMSKEKGTYMHFFLSLCFPLQVGTLLYARVVKANAGMNPELSCMDGWLCDSYFFIFVLNQRDHIS